MLHWTIRGREPGVHEASLRRYGSKLVLLHYCLFFIYISYSYLEIQHIDTINVPFCILQQLLKLMASNLNASMTSAYKILAAPWQISLVCWITGFTDPRFPTSNCSVEQPLWDPWRQLFKTHQGYLSGCGRILYANVLLALRLVAINLSKCCKMQNDTLIVSMYCICR